MMKKLMEIGARASAGVVLVLALLAGGAMAQSQAQAQTPAPAPAPAAAAIPDAKLQSFVEAAMKVEALIQKWNPIILEAPSEEEARTLSNQANDELEGAIKATDGISVEEYLQIAAQARSDPELSTRIRTIVQTRQP